MLRQYPDVGTANAKLAMRKAITGISLIRATKAGDLDMATMLNRALGNPDSGVVGNTGLSKLAEAYDASDLTELQLDRRLQTELNGLSLNEKSNKSVSDMSYDKKLLLIRELAKVSTEYQEFAKQANITQPDLVKLINDSVSKLITAVSSGKAIPSVPITPSKTPSSSSSSSSSTSSTSSSSSSRSTLTSKIINPPIPSSTTIPALQYVDAFNELNKAYASGFHSDYSDVLITFRSIGDSIPSQPDWRRLNMMTMVSPSTLKQWYDWRTSGTSSASSSSIRMINPVIPTGAPVSNMKVYQALNTEFSKGFPLKYEDLEKMVLNGASWQKVQGEHIDKTRLTNWFRWRLSVYKPKPVTSLIPPAVIGKGVNLKLSFGNFLIDRKKLMKHNILSITYPSGQKVKGFPNVQISDNLKKIFTKQKVNTKKMVLSPTERQFLHDLTTRSDADVSQSKRTVMGKSSYDEVAHMKDRLNILTGQLDGGNDNPAINDEIGSIITKLVEMGKIKRSEASEFMKTFVTNV